MNEKLKRIGMFRINRDFLESNDLREIKRLRRLFEALDIRNSFPTQIDGRLYDSTSYIAEHPEFDLVMSGAPIPEYQIIFNDSDESFKIEKIR